jgi:hypothetical protein
MASNTKIYEWVERFKRGRKCDDARSALPSTVTCVKINEKIDQLIRYIRTSSVDETASEMSLIK